MSTTTEPCSTGVINELGGCEPVGTEFEVCEDFPDDRAPTCSPTTPPLVIDGPAVVATSEPSPDFCFHDGKVFHEWVDGGDGTTGRHLMPCTPVAVGAAPTVATVTVRTDTVLPATGSGADAALIAVILLVSGAVASVIARWGKSHYDKE